MAWSSRMPLQHAILNSQVEPGNVRFKPESRHLFQLKHNWAGNWIRDAKTAAKVLKCVAK